MAGVTRRSKPLRGIVKIQDFDDFTLVNAAAGDLLLYDGTAWVNTTALTGSYTVAGTWQADDVTVDDDLIVGDDALISGNLSVTGTSALTGNVTVSGTTSLQALTVAGAATLESTLSLTGALTAAGFSFSGNGTITGTLGVTGISTLGTANITTLAVSGNSTLTGGLHVIATTLFDDQVTMGGSLSVSGGVAADTLGASSISVTGSVQAGSVQAGSVQAEDIVGGSIWQIDPTDLTDVYADALVTSGRWLFTGLDSADSENSLAILDPDGSFDAYHIGVLAALTTATGWAIRPSSGADANTVSITLENASGTDLANIGFLNLDDFIIRNLHTSGAIFLDAADSGDVNTRVFTGDPDGADTLYYAGIKSFDTHTRGFHIYSTNTEGTYIGFHDENGVLDGLIQMADVAGAFNYRCTIHGHDFLLQGEDAGGSVKNLIVMDPDTSVELFYAGTKEFETKSGGVIVDDELEINGALNHDGSTAGFYGATPTILLTGVAVTAAGIHAALVTLGLITA